jgi:ABC-type multidrug transport system ATPase subunit|tara:strand:+ start:792 stop:1463 length:672 start_codon:yes stop_codon:yes gene_type:complete
LIKEDELSYQPIIDVKNLSKSFSTGMVFHDINFHIQQQQRIALIGENGSGKTTLLKILAGIIKPTAGSVLFKTIDMHNMNLRKPFFGISIDESMLDNRMTVIDNLNLYCQLMDYFQYSEDIVNLMHQFQVAHVKNMKLNILSRGMQQRISLIRALLNQTNQDLLILDEPSKNLDVASKKILMEKVLQNANSTMIVATHDLDNISNWASHIYEIKNGNISMRKV